MEKTGVTVGSILGVRTTTLFTIDTIAGVTQLVEYLICNQAVGGSNPFAGSLFQRHSRVA